jgi:uncharacterized cupin superfamily protein
MLSSQVKRVNRERLQARTIQAGIWQARAFFGQPGGRTVSTTSLRAITAAESEVSSASLEPWGQRPGATGEAATSGWKLLDQDGLPAVGVWGCTPGSWTVTDRQDTETSIIVAGRARVTDADGTPHDLGPGDVLVLPLGWSGTWEILEPTRKVYIVAT